MTIPACVAVPVQARRWLAVSCDKKPADLKIARLRRCQHPSCHHSILLCTTTTTDTNIFSPTPLTTSRSLHPCLPSTSSDCSNHSSNLPLSRLGQFAPETTTLDPLPPLKPEPKPGTLEINPCCLATLKLPRPYRHTKNRPFWSLPLGRTSLIASLNAAFLLVVPFCSIHAISPLSQPMLW